MDWEKAWQTGNTLWDSGREHVQTGALLDLARTHMARRSPWRAFVPGCGQGHDAAWLVDKGFHVVATDVAATAIDQARKKYGTKANLEFRQEDVFETSPADVASFDVVFDSAMLCAIPVDLRRAYLEVCASLLKPGGLFLSIPFTKLADINGPPFGIGLGDLCGSMPAEMNLADATETGPSGHLPFVLCEAICVFAKQELEGA